MVRMLGKARDGFEHDGIGSGNSIHLCVFVNQGLIMSGRILVYNRQYDLRRWSPL